MPRVAINTKKYHLNDLEDYIRGEMRRKKMTQQQMAKLLGIEQPMFSRRLKGANFTVPQIMEIFKELNTDEERIGRFLKI